MGEQRDGNSLRQALVEHFSLDELKLLCHDAGIDPDTVPYSERGTEVYAFCVIETCRRKALLPALLQKCAQARPQVAWPAPAAAAMETAVPAEWAAWFAPERLVDTQGGTYIAGEATIGRDLVNRDQINITGLSADEITRLLQDARQSARQEREDALNSLQAALQTNQAVRDVITAARAIWQTAYAQVDRIGYAKGVHDLLQRVALAYNVLHPMLYEHDSLRPQESWRWRDVRSACVPLQALMQELLTYVGKRKHPDDSREEWVDELRQVDEDLANALTTEDAAQLDVAYSTLRYILDTQPTRYNARLGEAIDAMDAQRLITTLQGVANDIAAVRAQPDAHLPQRLDTFLGYTALIYQHVTDMLRLRNEHHRWQDFEDLLRTEYAQLNVDASRLKAQWHKRISPKLQAVVESGPPGRTQTVQSCARSFEASFATGNVIDVRESLWDLRSVTSVRFTQVDHDLKDVCQDLDKDSRPLSIAIEELH